tara:strand:- start:1502 stop:1960 length:459 start_codon:yes stop_codon:yes gene_type:complete
MNKCLNNTFLILWPLFIVIFIIPVGVINLFKVVIIPSLFSSNVVNSEDNIYRNNVNWGVTQSLPEPDVIINDNSIVVEAELFPDIDKIKKEHKKEIDEYNTKNKRLCLVNRRLYDENRELKEIIDKFKDKYKIRGDGKNKIEFNKQFDKKAK